MTTRVNRNVVVILVNYNSRQVTEDCIDSLCEMQIPEGVSLSVYVVNNGCYKQEVYNKYGTPKNISMKIIHSEFNLGFAGGNNIAIRAALSDGVDYIWLLNNDTIVDEMALREILKIAEEKPELGAIGSKIYYFSSPETVWFERGAIHWWKGTAGHVSKKRKSENLDYVTGCSILIKSRVLYDVGLLDENFFMYYEDVDLCCRIVGAGWKLGVASSSLVYHRVGYSGGGETSVVSLYHGNRSRVYFLRKAYFPKRFRLIALVFTVSSRIAKIVLFRIKGKRELSRAVWQGMKDALMLHEE